MAVWICAACGIEHPDTAGPPVRCEICLDERQFVPASGQAWTTSATLEKSGTTSSVVRVAASLHRIIVAPAVAIGQRSLLVTTPDGNLLWDPSGYIDASMIDAVRDLGGIAAVALSHPHMTGAAVSWARTFDVPLYFCRDDAGWIRRPDERIRLWSGTAELGGGIRLVQCGGHFAGSCVAHVPGIGGGALLTGDTIFPGPGTVSAMRSYPNKIPLPERAIRTILRALADYEYERLYGSFENDIAAGASAIVKRSLGRYIEWVRGEADMTEPSGFSGR
ncbi:MBL fold metallo-hydrolase [Spelaeicoccus albus]|uniref:Glyoxylase-like metal-dependent hydrolase (Beta-lactamase superfamily II) n=1 Tax=Spelaeicoccus albus TaxID=1280376 RepID=A0A7Z0IGZ0_9MICO|nr:MBL fold metallo-hydrolase [Spelaeicoccus albus]NYI67443.1 glyoxylase-like metal-dependent hydrolase (beta-lactamase superfamily II) [Spelaeicoccus albus]